MAWTKNALLVLFLVFIVMAAARSDEVKLSNGNSLACTVLQENDASIAVMVGASVIRLDRTQVAAVTKAAATPASKASESGTGIVRYPDIMLLLAKQTWAVDLHAIPATVVDTGPLKHVPYKSHRVAGECEVNVYGDPDQPTCVEVGLLGKFVNHVIAKQRCVEFVASLFDDETSQAIIVAMKKDKDLVKRDPLTFEITPATADDAYGGWWISVYNEKMLGLTRASEKELAAITTERQRASGAASPTPPVRRAEEDWNSWRPSDFQYARAPTAASSGTSGGGRVYVHGYTRKDGTYVHGHTRSK
jgi:hypothetical protein